MARLELPPNHLRRARWRRWWGAAGLVPVWSGWSGLAAAAAGRRAATTAEGSVALLALGLLWCGWFATRPLRALARWMAFLRRLGFVRDGAGLAGCARGSVLSARARLAMRPLRCACLALQPAMAGRCISPSLVVGPQQRDGSGVTGDPAFDALYAVSGPPEVIAFALPYRVRDRLRALADERRLAIADGALHLDVSTSDDLSEAALTAQLGELLDLLELLVRDEGPTPVAIARNALADPEPRFVALCLRVLLDRFPDAPETARAVEALRGHPAPAHREAVAAVLGDRPGLAGGASVRATDGDRGVPREGEGAENA